MKKTPTTSSLKKPKKAPEAVKPHPTHMKGGMTQEGYKGKAIEPKGKANGHGHTEHKGSKKK